MANTITPDHTYAIIGTGFSGMAMGVTLREVGEEDFVMLEKAAEVGGTWRDNTYPGCACDIPSHMYSFSFAQNPNWSQLYSGWQEILDYLIDCSEKFGLRDHVRFQKQAVELRYDDDAYLWHVTTSDGETLTARYVVAGTGPLSQPAVPDIPGLNDFAGPVMHSAKWYHEVDLTGKRIAVIGTGASSIQIVPSIAPDVERVELFQRTAPWVLPRWNKPVANWRRSVFRAVPWVLHTFRAFIYWSLEWRAFGFVQSPRFLRFFQRFAEHYIKNTIDDPELQRKVTPPYDIGCKRVLMSDDYYPALNRDNVDVHTEAIERIDTDAIVLRDGSRIPADVIVLGTGFHAAEPMGDLQVIGEGGRVLADEWAKTGPEAYYGVCVAGYPNCFTLLGANSGLGHNSVVFMAEAQVDMIMRIIQFARDRGALAVDVKDDVQAAFNRKLEQDLSRTVWQAGGCTSWYQIDGGKNFALWPSYTFKFRSQARNVPANNFEYLGEQS